MNHDFWWHAPRPENAHDAVVHETLFEHVRAVEDNQYKIHKQNLRNAKLYCNRKLEGLDWGSHTERQSNYAPISLTTEGLASSVVDTVTALIGKNRPKPTPVVRDADFSVELLGRQLDRYLYGMFKRLKVYERTIQVFNDACWAAIGALKIDIDDNEIFCERVNPDEIIVDQQEAYNCDPIQVHQRKLVPKVVMLQMYPERAMDIEMAQTRYTGSWTSYRNPSSGSMVVIESWKLPSGDEPGRHVICSEGVTFLDEEYTRDCFPFVFFRWSPLPTGFYGRPLIEEITPFQWRLNELNRKIANAQTVMCEPRIFMDRGSRVVKEQIDGQPFRVITYQGKPPEAITWPAMSPEIYSERERTISAAHRFAGISEYQAQGTLPTQARLDSSKAIREHNKRDDGRFARQAIRYENLHLEVAQHLLELSAILYKRKVNTRVQFAQRGLIEDIDWSAVHDLCTNKQFVLQIEASSLLNMTPAAREDILQQWAQQGIVSPQEYRHLLNHPDLEEQQDLLSIGIDDIKATSEKIDKGEFASPLPEQNLQFGVGYMHKMLLKRNRQKNVPEEVLQGYRDWIVQAQGLLDLANEKEKQAAQALQAAAMQSQEVPMDPDTGAPVPAVPVTTQGTPTTAL